MVDHARADSKALAAALAGVFFRLGFGLGPGIAGITAQYAANPRHLIFEIHIVLMIIGMIAVATASETLMRRQRGQPFRIRIGVPEGQALGFLTFVAPAAFMMSFIEGTLLSVVPIFVVETLHVHNLAVVGAIGFLTLAVGGLAPFVAGNLDPRRSVMLGVGVSAALSFLIVASSQVDAVGLVIFAAGAIGFINGFILYGGTVIAGTIVPIEERGKLMSLLYTFAYAGTVPTVALGYLADSIGLTGSLLIFSIAASCIALFVLLVGRRFFREVVPYVETVVVAPPPPTGEAAPAR